MKVYTHSKYSYVRVAEIARTEIDKIDFALCKQPKETLSTFYKRQTQKPALITNGGFFNMSNGETVMTYVDETKLIANENGAQYGIGIIGNSDIQYGTLTSQQWRDFVSAYPPLLENGKKLAITMAKEINYKARRTLLGYNNTTVFLVCIESPGMNFTSCQSLLLDLGCTYAINVDGGGSTKMLYNGSSVTKDATNRAVDNVIAVYLKSKSKYLTPDKKIPVRIQGKTITINQKIVPDNTVASKDIASYVKKGDLVKPQAKVDNGTGKPRGITVHNTGAISVNAATTMAEQYTRATYNGNMGGSMVHYYVSGYNEIWQLLNTEVGTTERGWHAGDGVSRRNAHKGAKDATIGGNLDTISIECIGDSAEAEDATALLVAYLCEKHNLNPAIDVYTHNFFIGKPDKIVNDGKKNCPIYILPHWKDFLNTVIKYAGGSTDVQKEDIDVIYQVYANNKWYSKVKNYNNTNSNGYAGANNKPIQALKIDLTKGHVIYRVHTINGKWWGWITDSTGSGANAYAGVLGKNIDAIQIKLSDDLVADYNIKYRVNVTSPDRWYPWVSGISGTGTNAYAGVLGRPIDKIQIYVEKK